MVNIKEKILPALSKAKKFVIRQKTILIALAAVLLAFCLVRHFSATAGKTRRVMYFEQIGSGKIEKEIRYIPKNGAKNALETYISELLLGPQIHRVRPLFSLGTAMEFCILKDDVLYVGLSSDAIFQDNDALTFEKGAELLKTNIKKNFPKIKEIEVFAGNTWVALGS